VLTAEVRRSRRLDGSSRGALAGAFGAGGAFGAIVRLVEPDRADAQTSSAHPPAGGDDAEA
jgi:hypothetical protein